MIDQLSFDRTVGVGGIDSVDEYLTERVFVELHGDHAELSPDSAARINVIAPLAGNPRPRHCPRKAVISLQQAELFQVADLIQHRLIVAKVRKLLAGKDVPGAESRRRRIA